MWFSFIYVCNSKMYFKPNKNLSSDSDSDNFDSVSILKSKFKPYKTNALRFKVFDKNKTNRINKWEEKLENIKFKEPIFPLKTLDIPVEKNDLKLKYSQKNYSLQHEDRYCNTKILKTILMYKSEFDLISPKKFQTARSKSNLFELIFRNSFMNRSAVKMANINYLFDGIFTKQKTFADICSGPGGFTEYILKNTNFSAKGYGITLKNKNDFKLNKILLNNQNSFITHYGYNDTGNIYDPKIIDSFTQLIFNETKIGVDFMMGDGGFSVIGQENVQEILSKRLYLCQCLLALKTVKVNGHCIIKFFDTFTKFTVDLLYLMCKCFKNCQIIKLNSSRPANSERFLICLNKYEDVSLISNYLYNVNVEMHKNFNENLDVHGLLGEKFISNDETFINNISEINNEIGKKQINAMEKLMHCIKHPHETFCNKQIRIKNQCLKLWNL